MIGQRPNVMTAVYQQAKAGQIECGDSYFYTETDEEFICALADGLGSGESAKESADIVINIIKHRIYATVNQLIQHCNQQLSGKRGVVVGLLKINFFTRRYTFSSIGNIGMMTIPENGVKNRHIPNSGYLAGFHQPFKVVSGKLDTVMNFILFSDGVSDRDITQNFLLTRNVQQVVDMYSAYKSGQTHDDDTTMIAIQYQE
ncbi:phosphoserine phosphatase RsbX [Lentibacillus halophilus]|uniref:Phosphoserine phosphatase RsbX n=1 Tax=Lentibacillus halophilus TaxID=295065 RepID=A0ABN0Z3W5_9BACI